MLSNFLLLIAGVASFCSSLFRDPFADDGRSSLVSLPRPSSSMLSMFWANPSSGGGPCSLCLDDNSLSGGGRLCDG